MRGRKKGSKTARVEIRPTQPTKNTQLAVEIVLFAIKDWRELIRQKAWKFRYVQKSDRNFNELRKFFKSEWCAFLMQDYELTPETTLATLENELREAMEKDRVKEDEK